MSGVRCETGGGLITGKTVLARRIAQCRRAIEWGYRRDHYARYLCRLLKVAVARGISVSGKPVVKAGQREWPDLAGAMRSSHGSATP